MRVQPRSPHRYKRLCVALGQWTIHDERPNTQRTGGRYRCLLADRQSPGCYYDQRDRRSLSIPKTDGVSGQFVWEARVRELIDMSATVWHQVDFGLLGTDPAIFECDQQDVGHRALLAMAST